MIINTKFGIGEIVAHEVKRNGEFLGDCLYEVIGIMKFVDGISYACRHPTTGQVIHFAESELIGDPDYNQYTGSYLENVEPFMEVIKKSSNYHVTQEEYEQNTEEWDSNEPYIWKLLRTEGRFEIWYDSGYGSYVAYDLCTSDILLVNSQGLVKHDDVVLVDKDWFGLENFIYYVQ